MTDFTNDPHELLDLEDGPSEEELQDQIEKAQSELIELKQRQDQIEKEKLRLEELSRKQEELERGRLEIADKLTRSLILVQRETEESQRRLEQLTGIQASFSENLKELEQIDPKSWGTRDLTRELTHAIGTVDEARASYSRNQAKIAPLDDLDEALENSYNDDMTEKGQGFLYWLQIGTAFTSPLLVLGIIALIIWVWHFSTAAAH